jgi:hypothetical protein
MISIVLSLTFGISPVTQPSGPTRTIPPLGTFPAALPPSQSSTVPRTLLFSIAVAAGLTLAQDTFDITDGAGTPLSISSNGIAWKSDVDRKFRNPPTNQTSGLPPIGNYILNPALFPKNIEDERFIVWMRLSALPEFRKLWGRIDTPVAAGSLTVLVTNSTSALLSSLLILSWQTSQCRALLAASTSS